MLLPTGVGGEGAAQPGTGARTKKIGHYQKKQKYPPTNTWSRRPWHCPSATRSRRADGKRRGTGTGLNRAVVDREWSLINLREVCVCIRAPFNSVC